MPMSPAFNRREDRQPATPPRSEANSSPIHAQVNLPKPNPSGPTLPTLASPALGNENIAFWDSSRPSATERIFPIRSMMTKSPSSSTQTEDPNFRRSNVPLYTAASEASVTDSLAGSSKASGRRTSNVRLQSPLVDGTTHQTQYFDPRPRRPSEDIAEDAEALPGSYNEDRLTPDGSMTSNNTARTKPSTYQPSSRRAEIDEVKSQRSQASATKTDPLRQSGGIGLYASGHEQEMMSRAEDARKRHDAGSSNDVTKSYGEQIMSVRFEHQETAEGHMILTGREGELAKCEDEPIHVPGAVQAWGVLVAVEYDIDAEDGPIQVKQVSENSGLVLGWPPSYLLQLRCLTEALDPEEADTLRDALALSLASAEELTESGPHHFELSASGIPGTGMEGPESQVEWTCWCSSHKPSKNQRPNLFVIEFELQEDLFSPAHYSEAADVADDDRGGLAGEPYEPTSEDLRESTVSASKPLRTTVRRKRAHQTNISSQGYDVFRTLSQVTDQLAKAEDLQSFLKLVVGVIKDVTGYHRVMVYQFDEAWNGQVVAELVDWSKTRDLYRGLHFPATDIPAQAREMYKVNRVRLLYDRDQPTARMVCQSRRELDIPLDMTHVALRAMSPIHIKYLANMGVRASGSVSITAFGNLWGLISCHSYGRYGMRITDPQRQLCRLLAGDISRNIERLSYAQRLQSRKLINTVSTQSNPSGYIVAKAEDLLTLFDADFGVLSIGEEAKLLGSLDNSQEVLTVLEYLRVRRFDSIQVTQQITNDFPDLLYPGGFQVVAGFLCVPLSSGGRDFIAFFRRGQIKHIHWAGNPYDKILKETASTRSALEPRTSFKLWSETILGKCRNWTDEQLETASVLCLVYGKFIEVWRQKESALKSNQLTNILLSNASHEVRTPLNAIVNYLEMALDGPLDGETREALRKSYTASKSLIHVINDLLDLTRTEEGNDLFLQDPFEVVSTIEEAVEIHRSEAERRKIAFRIEGSAASPRIVVGDRARFKQVINNLAANAVKHTHSGDVTIEYGPYEEPHGITKADDDHLIMAFSVRDTGVGMATAKLDDIFRQLEQVELYDTAEAQSPQSQKTVGLGLAVVARVVRNLRGQLRVESVEGQGSKFTVLLPFKTANDQSQTALHRSNSRGSQKSMQSNNSNKSEIDSLVEAISAAPSGQSGPSSVRSDTSTGTPDIMSTATFSPRLNTPRRRSLDTTKSVAVEGSSVPLKPLRVDYDDSSATHQKRPSFNNTPTVLQMPSSSNTPLTPPDSPFTTAEESRPKNSESVPWQFVPSPRSPNIRGTLPNSANVKYLRVLVVEDDPINRAIINKKLVKEGHTVTLTVHGEEAVRAFQANHNFDVVLMDLQMPICDGFTATKRIRATEKDEPSTNRPASHELLGRIPIVAVSASLHERQVQELIDTGMDAWLLKPINFERMRIILSGATNADDRRAEAYKPGFFQKGGWL